MLRCTRLLFACLTVLGAHSARAQAARGAPPSQAQLLQRLGQVADSLRRSDAFSGVILVARNGTPVLHRAYGLADRDAKVPNDTNTAFNVSSIGKLFTQTAIAQLVAQGKVSLDSTLATYWPDYPNRDARRVTVRQLLEHQSGIDGNIFQNPARLRSNHDYLAAFVDNPLAFAPGSQERYSNAGYVVLGEIVSRVSGEDYYDYVARHVFAPAGMRRTGYPPPDAPLRNSAIGYTAQGTTGQLRSNADVRPARGSAAGGAYSTTSDLLRFVMARRAGRLGAAAESQREAIAGGSPGSNGIVLEGLPQGYDLVVLANLDPPAALRISQAMEASLGVGAAPAVGATAATAVTTTTMPDTPAGRAAADYLKAFNSGDAAEMRRFMETSVVPDPARPWDARVDGYRRIFAEQGTLTLTSAESVDPQHVRLHVTSEKQGPLLVIMTVAPDGAHRISTVEFEIQR